MDDEHEGTKNPLSQNDDGELDVTREKTDFTELANARAKEAMDQLENMRFASREARRKREEIRKKEQRGTIHLSDAVDIDPEMMREAEQKYDEFGQPINDPADFGQFGQSVEGQMPMGGINGVGPVGPVPNQPVPGGQMPNGPMNGQMNYGPMPNGAMGGQMNGMANGGQMNGMAPGGPQMAGQMGVVTNLDGTVPIASLDPTSRPMKQVPTVVVQKPKKIRKGWLVAISVSAFVAIALAVLAVLIVATNKPDTVVKAIENITTNGLMENIAVNGEMEFNFTDDNLAIDTLTVDLEGKVKTKNLENNMNAKIVANMTGGDKLGVEADEVYVKESGVYLKLNKAGALIKEINKSVAKTDETVKEETDTATDEKADGATDEKTNETAAEKAKRETEKAWALVADIIAKTDDKWLRINSDEANTSGLPDTKGGACEAALMNNLAANQATIATIYRTFPFISSTTKGIELTQAQNTVYKVNIDLNNLTSFFNEIEGLKSMKAYEECKGYVQPAIVGSNVAEIFSKMKNIYVEVSEDYLITRVYFEYAADWGEMVADFYLSYPESVRIEAPEESVDLSQVLKSIAK